ncbi:hypothetical protein ABTC54_19360, partial [Acinetobacter baumannii]
DPCIFNLGGETHPYVYCVSLKEKSSEWSDGIFHPIMQSHGKTPISVTLVTATYSTVNSESLQNRK